MHLSFGPRLALRAAAALVALLVVSPALAKPGTSVKAFKFKGGKVDVGTVYRYEKSDLQGSRPTSFLLYVATKNRLELVRAEPGAGTAETFVVDVDWSSGGSPLRVEHWVTHKDGSQSRAYTAGYADAEGAVVVKPEDLNGFRMAGLSGPASVAVDQYPVHPLGLELATLNFAFRHLAEPMREFEIGLLADAKAPAPVAGGTSPIVYLGRVKVSFVEEVNRDGNECRKYRLSGAPLGAGEGFVWIHKEKGYVLDMELPVPTTVDRNDAKLVFQGTETLDDTGWQRRKAEEIAKALK